MNGNYLGNAILSNYIFASLGETEITTIIESMEVLDVSRGENIITQGSLIEISNDYEID